MASTYTDNIRIEKITTGEKAGEWGDITNNNFDRLDVAINGLTSVEMTSSHQSAGDANTIALGTSTVDEAGRNQFIEFTAAASPNTPAAEVFAKLESQDAQKVCYVRNSTGQTLSLFQGTHDSNNDVSIASGKDAIVKFDGNGASAVVSLVYNNPEIATLTTSGNVTIGGDLTISGDDLTMGTNTSGHILVADGTNYNPVAVSGDITLGSDGAAAIASGVIVNADINASAAIADTKLATISSVGKVANSATTATTSNTANTIVLRDGSGNIASSSSGNAATATALETARTIGGVSFDGTANINLPGVNTAGNQDTTGNAATATTGTNVTVTNNSSTDETVYLTFVDGTSGSQGIEVDSGLTYNPSTNTLGNTAVRKVRPFTTSENSGGYHLLFSDEYNTTGSIFADFSISVNPSTNILSAGGFSTTGTVSGNKVTGSSARTINNYVAEFTNTVSSTASASKIMKLRFSDATVIDGADFVEFHDGSGAIGSVSSTSSSSGVNYNTSSDARLKRNVEDAPSQWHTIRNMDVREYEWISSGQSEIGFIAQELNAVAPQCVTEGGESPTQDPWSVDYGRITPFLVKALQEAMDRIEELEDRLDQVS